ncbi:hypothetical protein [Paraburkholderia tagetis]|uniref:Uncharacterized protein n=1 Tax=Paraburkholderia tagetis TaxID=2913261 RepID=A0A9X1UKB6_9BURK|nr:hypothetical protein [Paraburkholderia tagetis]MCG5073271.1 hypothetical protein [Paraburkholderia tagetis]
MFFRSGSMRFPPGSRVSGSGRSRDLDRIELDLARDRHARAAMEAYADSCEAELPWLSEVLRQSRFGRSERLTQCPSTVLRTFVLAQARAAAQPDYAHAAWEHVRRQLAALLSEAPMAEPAASEVRHAAGQMSRTASREAASADDPYALGAATGTAGDPPARRRG